MNTPIHMQDQITNRIDIIMQDSRNSSWDDYAQTAVTILIIFVFLTLGLGW